MTKNEMKAHIDELYGQIDELQNENKALALECAHKEGFIQGLEFRKSDNHPDSFDDEDVEELYDDSELPEGEVDRIMNKLEKTGVVDMHENCDCPKCQNLSAKEKSLISSSREIRKWAKKAGVKVEKGDANDN